MASADTRKNPMATETAAINHQSGALAGALSSTLAARVRELVTRGLSYDEAQVMAETELFGNLRTSLSGVRHG